MQYVHGMSQLSLQRQGTGRVDCRPQPTATGGNLLVYREVLRQPSGVAGVNTSIARLPNPCLGSQGKGRKFHYQFLSNILAGQFVVSNRIIRSPARGA